MPISGAGTSVWIPMRSWIFWVKTRVNRSSSEMLSLLGSQPMPPLAPPYGMLATAVFHVMSWANAFTSSGSTCRKLTDNRYQIISYWIDRFGREIYKGKDQTSGWYLIPPFIGPLALSCWTLNPTNDAIVPSSFGMVHSTCKKFDNRFIIWFVPVIWFNIKSFYFLLHGGDLPRRIISGEGT